MGVSWYEVSTGTIFVSQTFTSYDTNVVGTESVSESYKIIYASPTTYKVEIVEVQPGATFNATAWFLRDGDLAAYDYLGQNMTGSEATNLVQGLLSPFFYQSEYTSLLQTFESTSGVQSSSQGFASVGSTVIALTNYTAPTPLNVSICGGSLDLTDFSLQTGSVQGAGVQLLMAMNLAGSETYHGATNQIEEFTLRLTSIQSA
jgi:hypothetical protein